MFALRIPEAPRGQYEMKDVLGEVIDTRPTPMSIESAFARLKQIRTVHTGADRLRRPRLRALHRCRSSQSLYVEDEFGLDALERGLLGSLGGLFALAVLPFAARGYDARFREDPAEALRLVGLLIMPVAVVVPIQYSMPNVAVVRHRRGDPADPPDFTAFTMVGPSCSRSCPYRLRGMGAALGRSTSSSSEPPAGRSSSAFLVDVIGPKAAVLILVVPSTLIGGLLLVRSASFIKSDLSMVVAELREEMDEHQRQQAEPDEIPALQVNNIDFSYGHVQVLFDVGVRGAQGRGPRPARHERRGQVDDPARDRRARHAGAWRRAPQRRTITYVVAREAGAAWASDCCPAARACSRR